MKDKSRDPKPAAPQDQKPAQKPVSKKPASPAQRSYGPQQGQRAFGGPSKSQKSAAHRLGKSRKVH
jgi:hypothetical protein